MANKAELHRITQAKHAINRLITKSKDFNVINDAAELRNKLVALYKYVEHRD